LDDRRARLLCSSLFFFGYQGYFVDYFQFASLMGFDGDDVLKDR
jgi:hypothetical protein